MNNEEFSLEGLEYEEDSNRSKAVESDSDDAVEPVKNVASDSKSSEPDFEKSLKRLESIVSEMEQGKLSLDESLKRFEEGTKLANYCSEKLSQSEKKIEILLKNKDRQEWTNYESGSPNNG